MKLLKLVSFMWIDSQTTHGWEHIDDLPETLEAMPAAGYVIAETDEYIRLAISYAGDSESANPTMTIPKVCIVSEIKLLDQIKI